MLIVLSMDVVIVYGKPALMLQSISLHAQTGHSNKRFNQNFKTIKSFIKSFSTKKRDTKLHATNA